MDEEFDNEPLDTILTLPSGLNAAQLSRACREAALEFVDQSKRWGKPELSMWLSGTYAELTKHAVKVDEEEQGHTGMWPIPLLKDIDVRLIDRIMTSARTEIFETLQTLATEGAASFVLKALISGSVVRCEDARNEPTWAPGQATRLADRVLSLFATDYLSQPGEYEALFVCTECETVMFDAAAKARNVCPNHAVSSVAAGGMPRLTLPYPGMGA